MYVNVCNKNACDSMRVIHDSCDADAGKIFELHSLLVIEYELFAFDLYNIACSGRILPDTAPLPIVASAVAMAAIVADDKISVAAVAAALATLIFMFHSSSLLRSSAVAKV